ncbi:hypothetical protein B0H21DRAFT_766278 [Amylocystis lapponica]|nr:hypothetical protein B0H21DRAFT_766278 [Amylocystis lapponica]
MDYPNVIKDRWMSPPSLTNLSTRAFAHRLYWHSSVYHVLTMPPRVPSVDPTTPPTRSQAQPSSPLPPLTNSDAGSVTPTKPSRTTSFQMPSTPRAQQRHSTSESPQNSPWVLRGMDARQPPDYTTPLPVFSALCTAIPAPGPVFPGTSGATKNMSNAELSLDVDKRLANVVYFPGMVKQLRDDASVMLQGLSIDWSEVKHRDIACQLLPYNTSRNLPTSIRTEKDVEDWTRTTLFRPALTAIKAVLRGQLNHDFRQTYPNLSSASHDAVIPDAVLFSEIGLETKAVLVIENKTPLVLQTGSLMNDEHIFMSIMDEKSNVPPGLAMKFNWPASANDIRATADRENVQMKVLIQVWTQLVHHDCNLGILATSELTIFFARDKDRNPDTLYISSSFSNTECPLLATFCWFAIASGKLDFNRLNLPSPITNWWSYNRLIEAGEYNSPGIVRATLYVRYGATSGTASGSGTATSSGASTSTVIGKRPRAQS